MNTWSFPVASARRAGPRAAFAALALAAATVASASPGPDIGYIDDLPLIPYSGVVIDEQAELDGPGTDAVAQDARAIALVQVQADSIVPLPRVAKARMPARPLRVDRAYTPPPPSVLRLFGGEAVQVHADGMPTANAPSSDPFVRVLPRAVNPADVKVGARWGAQDRIDAPLLSAIAWDAHADLLAGAPPPRAGNVRRSLRITAKWDTPEDLAIGFTPGYERGGGTLFEHYVTGLQASTDDKARRAHWSSFVEVSGEKLAPGNVIDNPTAQVNAGLSYQASTFAQFDLSVSRSTMTTLDDFHSNLGLSVHF